MCRLTGLPDAPTPRRTNSRRTTRGMREWPVGDRRRLWKRFGVERRYGTDEAVIAAYAEALRGSCHPLLGGDPALWERLRHRRRARIASNLRRIAERNGESG
jgi:hypothetical protein